MYTSTAFWQLGGMVFTSVVGTVLHFVFDWTGGNAAVGVFTAVNESIWEHTKLLLVPMALWTLIEAPALRRRHDAFWCAKLRGTLLGIFLIPTMYYVYSGILGVSSDYVNITIFFVAAAIAYRTESRWLSAPRRTPCRASLVWAVWGAVFLLYAVWTFLPPPIPLFRDPVSGAYGSV